jgi:hypothetical protein
MGNTSPLDDGFVVAHDRVGDDRQGRHFGGVQGVVARVVADRQQLQGGVGVGAELVRLPGSDPVGG